LKEWHPLKVFRRLKLKAEIELSEVDETLEITNSLCSLGMTLSFRNAAAPDIDYDELPKSLPCVLCGNVVESECTGRISYI
jgi:hypothetical protein